MKDPDLEHPDPEVRKWARRRIEEV